jgi:dolichol kinase
MSEGTLSQEVLKLKIRSDLHLARKLYHTLGVLLIFWLYQILTREQGLILLGSTTVVVAALDFIRLRSSQLNRFMFNTFGLFLRRDEATRMSGMSSLLFGVLVIVFFLPHEVANLAILFLAFGDPFASAIGVIYGKDKILPNKSLQGFLGAFAICAVTSVLYFNFTHLLMERWILASLLGGLIGALSELIAVGRLDDNLSIPVVSGGLLWAMFWFLGGFT